MREKKKALRRHIHTGGHLRGRDGVEGEIWTKEAYARAGLERFATLFSYLSFPTEPKTAPLHEQALALGLSVAVPRVHGTFMGFYRLAAADGPFAVGPYGIREPLPEEPALWLPKTENVAPDGISAAPLRFPLLVAVPGLAFAPDGRRLGRGGGYYDRFIEELFAAYPVGRDRITLMGICPESSILADIPVETHDARVDCLLTEKRYIICNELREE